MEGLDSSVEDGVVALDIGGDDGEGEIGEEGAEFLGASIEFVVSKRHAVEAHLIEGFGDLLTTIVGVEESTLGV